MERQGVMNAHFQNLTPTAKKEFQRRRDEEQQQQARHYHEDFSLMIPGATVPRPGGDSSALGRSHSGPALAGQSLARKSTRASKRSKKAPEESREGSAADDDDDERVKLPRKQQPAGRTRTRIRRKAKKQVSFPWPSRTTAGPSSVAADGHGTVEGGQRTDEDKDDATKPPSQRHTAPSAVKTGRGASSQPAPTKTAKIGKAKSVEWQSSIQLKIGLRMVYSDEYGAILDTPQKKADVWNGVFKEMPTIVARGKFVPEQTMRTQYVEHKKAVEIPSVKQWRDVMAIELDDQRWTDMKQRFDNVIAELDRTDGWKTVLVVP